MFSSVSLNDKERVSLTRDGILKLRLPEKGRAEGTEPIRPCLSQLRRQFKYDAAAAAVVASICEAPEIGGAVKIAGLILG